ncbi:DUF2829 domain-containing protein [Methylobacterium sp. V23]|uniref:DUF2829 domain-containing protein n=1 Tax=Methylobacterium sp. V23 TaxID=2044878 RepID=UPI000CDA50B9|nr:DUF2829 domain-containing protein [Methylobacterium sp. V23]POR42541.1 hypothetical protein CRT23_12175 [Methylobacterium sp. V23]
MVDGTEQALAFADSTARPFTPTHVSHKQVEAYPLVRLDLDPSDERGLIAIVDDGGALIPIKVPADITARGVPQAGSMLVRYAPDKAHPEGYLSFSPRGAFDAGNTSLGQAVRDLAFGQAIAALKAGSRVAREGWNGKGMWLSLSGPLPGREIAFENFWSSNNSEFARQNGGSATVLPCITMKTATGEILMGWLASQTDMLAEDWCVV